MWNQRVFGAFCWREFSRARSRICTFTRVTATSWKITADAVAFCEAAFFLFDKFSDTQQRPWLPSVAGVPAANILSSYTYKFQNCQLPKVKSKNILQKSYICVIFFRRTDFLSFKLRIFCPLICFLFSFYTFTFFLLYRS